MEEAWDQGASHKLTQHGCSWCFGMTNHALLRQMRGVRNLYVCDACGRPTVRCLVHRCKGMARSTGHAADKFCAVHDGTIGSFENLAATISDPTEFAGLLQRRNGRNWSKIARVGGAAVGSAALFGFSAVLAAPAIGGAIGSSFMGLSGAAATSAGLALLGGGSLAGGGFGMVGGTCVVSALGALAGSAAGGRLVNDYLSDVKGFSITRIRDGKDPALICIDGFLKEKSATEQRWLKGLGERYEGHAVYHVRWESKRLQELGRLVSSKTFASGLRKLVKTAALRSSRLATVRLLPLTIPLSLAGTARNPWVIALIKSEKTGELVKEMLARCQGRSFILAGHSLGARVIVRALASFGTIADEHRRSRVIGAHLLGGAVGTEPAEAWDIVVRAVDQGVHSYYSRNDQVLQTLYRVGTLFRSPAIGRGPIPETPETRAKLKNFDVSRFVSRHGRYHEGLHRFLEDF